MQESLCPDSEQLRRLMLGSLPEAAADAVGSHLLECDRCGDTVAGLEASDTLVDALKAAPQAAVRLPRGEVVEAAIERAVRLGRPATGEPTDAGAGAEETALGMVDTPSGERSSVFDDDEYAGLLALADGPGEIGRLGPYRVLRLLGTGGMGVVFLAEDEQLQRPVALKVMKPALAALDENRRRFLREARSAAALRDEHVVTIYQVGEDRGVPWLAMELLEGESLHERLKRDRRLAVLETVQIGRQVAQALAAAHHRGLIHRDIKPSNVMVESRGSRLEGQKAHDATAFAGSGPLTLDPRPSVKLLDFGLARSVDGETHLTQTGLIVGTPAYMAPEQARGEHTDHRCDLFSLGCVLYHALAGRQPFRGKDTLSTLMALATAEVAPLAEVRPEVPAELSDLVARLMSKAPAGRPDSAAEVVQTLAGIERRLVAAEEAAARGTADSPSGATAPLTTGALPASPGGATSAPAATASYQTSAADVHSGSQPSTFDSQLLPADAESSLVRTIVSRAAKQRRQARHRWLAAGTLLAVAAVAVVVFSGILFKVKTEHGTLVIQVDDPRNVVVTIDGEQVEAKIGPDGQTVLVAVDPGTHKLAVTAGGVTLKPDSDTFSIEAGGRKVLTARLQGSDDLPGGQGATGSQAETVAGGNFALRFDGVDDFVDIPTLKYNGQQPLTLELRARPESHNSYRQLALVSNFDYRDKQEYGISLLQRGDTYPQPRYASWAISFAGERGRGHSLIADSESWKAGRGSHLAFVVDGRRYRFLIDGRLWRWGELDVAPAHSARQFQIGGHQLLRGFFQGELDEVRISNVARYTEDYTPAERFEPDEHTLALYHFDEGEGDVLVDSSGNGHHGKIVGATWVKEVAPGKYAAYDQHRIAAEWILSRGGTVTVFVDGAPEWTHQRLSDVAALPSAPFRMHNVYLRLPGDTRDAQDPIVDADVETLGRLLQGIRLHNLRISGERLSDRALRHLPGVDFLVLDMPGFTVDGDGLAHLAAIPSLRTVLLPDVRGTDRDLHHFERIEGLARLQLNGWPITDHGMATLAALPTLAELFLMTDRLTDQGMVHLAGHSTLRTLNLYACSLVGDESIVHISTIAQLEHLSLRSKAVTDARLRELARLSSLASLNLSGTQITDSGLRELARIPTLTKLQIVGTGVTRDGVHALREALPNCTVVWEGNAEDNPMSEPSVDQYQR